MIPLAFSELSRLFSFSYQGNDALVSRICHDSRKISAGDTYLAIKGENFDGHQFCQAAVKQGATSLIVEQLQTDIQIPQLVVPDAIEALSKIAAYNRKQSTAKTIAITGSSGKSTVKQMLLAICQEAGKTLATHGNLNNHIGVPLTLLALDDSHQYAVVELGANHIGEIAQTVALTQPDIALVNNVSAAHLEGFGSIDGVVQAKGEIYQGLSEQGIAVVNADLDCLPAWQPAIAGLSQFSFSMQPFADVYAKDIQLDENLCAQFTWFYRGQSYFVKLPAPGVHNVNNALAAITCALAAGIQAVQICAGLNKMQSMQGRVTRYQLGPLTLIDDSYNANEGSVKAAIDLLDAADASTILVIGELAEMGQYAEAVAEDIAQYWQQKSLTHVLAVGSQARFVQPDLNWCFDDLVNLQRALTVLIKDLIHSNNNKKVFVLVKGSRSAGMEAVVAYLKEQFKELQSC
ncbi:UDP-N-acetylmuramoyl-tripeptide--D-alanyl-D-alanine ligase [Gayadomonas joobiniege]|uniref:UDP-N-acetylmuramoyl-tripeptide--D-alanyl-D- alanine ligase n=1 Tax=Gayadomonas joobiniege TaxID=1234606 RepID=UPI00036A0979|nr:UDP-N-acetylmuramoyl-tripeptide--D-alanyl-D-alanine ligase [Gayadomonas joobiniege]